MRMCPNCRTYVNDGCMFCQTCGNQTVGTEVDGAPRRSPNIRCPQCGETQALKSSVVAVGKTSRVYWVCRTCRNKFRDPKDLDKELRTLKHPRLTLIVYLVGVLLMFMLFILGCSRLAEYNNLDYWTKLANEGYQASAWFLIVLGLIGCAAELVMMYLFAQKWRQLEQEKSELKGYSNQRNLK